jgi:hypothetical protein
MGELQRDIGQIASWFPFRVVTGRWGAAEPNRMKALAAAGQVAEFSAYDNVAVLVLEPSDNRMLVLSFQAVGPRYRGLISVVAYFSTKSAEPMLIDESFQINYEELLEHTKARFAKWLEGLIVEGLNEWRRTL